MLDFWNVMAHDYAGQFSGCPFHQPAVFDDPSVPKTTLFNTNPAVQQYVDARFIANNLSSACLVQTIFWVTEGLESRSPVSGEGPEKQGSGGTIWICRNVGPKNMCLTVQLHAVAMIRLQKR